jgi:hypothetical protein
MVMGTALEIYSAYQQRLQTQDYAHLGEVVDLTKSGDAGTRLGRIRALIGQS